jgi:hypothetical protein
MALETENGTMGTTMLVQPSGIANNGNGFGWGGDGFWIILLFLLLGNNGWGGFGGFGGGMWGMDGLYPWMNQSNQINSGFRDQMVNDNVTSIRDGVHGLSTQLCNCCGDMQMSVANGFAGVQQSMCNGFAGTTAAITGAQNALAQQMYTNQIADLERSYAAQTANTAGLTNLSSQLANCCCENRMATADTKYTIATEACANRTANAENTRDIIDAQTRSTQAILDKLCALELDNVKGQLASAQRENVGLQNQLNMAAFRESQANQNALIQQGFNNEIDGLYNRLSNCPVPSVPVYGRQPIFNCQQNACGCGCGCNG